MRLPSIVLNNVNQVDRLEYAIQYLTAYCEKHENSFAKEKKWYNEYKKPKTVRTLEMLMAIRDGEYPKEGFKW